MKKPSKTYIADFPDRRGFMILAKDIKEAREGIREYYYGEPTQKKLPRGTKIMVCPGSGLYECFENLLS